MASILPSYGTGVARNVSYDIFISYRQKDNLSSSGNGWVTEFVQALKNELEATFKEEISVYFDENPHDGLHDTHDVDESLKEKVQCLIFIPIVSRTYCDPNSFAWAKELLPFLDFAKNDEFGLKVKVANGNVASRVLPVRIHDLDKGDVALFEQVTTGVLRSVDFVYKGTGVNRPLREKDDDQLYLDQLNKLANSIREIINSMKRPANSEVHSLPSNSNTSESQDSIPKTGLKKILIPVLILALVSLGFYFFLPDNNDQGVPEINESIEKSVAVMPFEDLSPDNDQEWFSDGLSEEIINSLFNVSELEIRGRNSSFAFKGKSMTIKQFADTLNVNYVVEGSVRKFGDDLRITVQLIRASDDTHLWSQQYDRDFENIFAIQTDIANSVAKTLNIYLDEEQRENMLDSDTRNPEAYEYFLKGNKIFNDAHETVNRYLLWEANEWFDKALDLDSNMATAWNYKADAYEHYGFGHMNTPPGIEISPKKAKELHQEYLKKASEAAKSNTVIKYHYRLDYLITMPHDWTEVKTLVQSIVDHFEPNKVNGVEEFVAVFIYPLYGKETAIKFLDEEINADPLYVINKYFYKWHIYQHEGNKEEADKLITHLSSTYRESIVFTLYNIIEKDWATLDSLFVKVYDNRDNLFMNDWWKLTLQTRYKSDTIPDPEVKDNIQEALWFANYHWQNKNPKMAARIMNQIDNDPDVKYFRLLFSLITRFGYNIPFEIDSMPNFKKRLREAGIDPQFFRPMPIVKEEYLQWRNAHKN